LDIFPGEFLVIFGPSGSGKSTLTDMLGLLLRPDNSDAFRFYSPGGLAGTAPVGIDLMASSGRVLAGLRRSRLGYVLQSGGLLGFLSVRSNIMLPALLNHSSHPRDDVNHWARSLGIGDQLSKKPQFLSGGQRQRAAIARALIHQPEMILADEPTASVDRFTAVEIVSELRRITTDTGSSVVVVTHDLELVRQVADRFYEVKAERVCPGLTRSCCSEVSLSPAAAFSAVQQGTL
jgi:putative ABC transport system ATP-binding protein